MAKAARQGGGWTWREADDLRLAKRIFCALIRDPEADGVLRPYGALMARARHWCFKQVHVLGRDLGEVKTEGCERSALTSRQFNSVRFDVDGQVNGWKGTLGYQVQSVEGRIASAERQVAAIQARMDRPGTTDPVWDRLKTAIVGKRQ